MPSRRVMARHGAALAAAAHRDVDHVALDALELGEAAVGGERRVDLLLEELLDLLGDRAGELEVLARQRVGAVRVAEHEARAAAGGDVERGAGELLDASRRAR